MVTDVSELTQGRVECVWAALVAAPGSARSLDSPLGAYLADPRTDGCRARPGTRWAPPPGRTSICFEYVGSRVPEVCRRDSVLRNSPCSLNRWRMPCAIPPSKERGCRRGPAKPLRVFDLCNKNTRGRVSPDQFHRCYRESWLTQGRLCVVSLGWDRVGVGIRSGRGPKET